MLWNGLTICSTKHYSAVEADLSIFRRNMDFHGTALTNIGDEGSENNEGKIKKRFIDQ